uniref:Rho-GAP domain-containing protein n=1 Tax=Anopheles christyi TaxID=43041 RepID=A0A182JZH6_9DIPT
MTDVEESTRVRLDQEIAIRLQNEHPEQFVTLVRMHLSFELDLHTDTENDPAGLDKQKLKKWKGFHKKAKGCTSAKATSPEMAKAALTKANIEDVKQLIAFLEQDENISQEGIFRKTGSLTRQNELKNSLLSGNVLPLDEAGYTAHDCASVLKSFLADLPEPLLTELYYPAYCQVADLYHSKETSERNEDRLLNALQLLLLLLPEENNILLRHIIELLHRTIQHEATNKMSAVNLATLFTPHLICPRKQSPEALHTTAQHMSGIVGFMIKTGPRLFHIPPKLATDIRAYFVEQRRRKTMSPEHILNESTTSDSVANTVYTFVDRQKTAEALVMNSTDTALAQLYAHIQSLPESSKKKKLVSKFNRQNGYGTPLQVLMLREKNGSGTGSAGPGSGGGLKYPRSISDSIKRHIFHKSLMSRTPKRGAGGASSGSQTPTTFQTPNGASYGSGPRQRVLFQSPVSASDSPSSVGSPVCIKRCSSVSSSSSSLSSMSSSSGTRSANVGTLTRTISAESSSSSTSSSSTHLEVSKPEVLKRRSSGEAGVVDGQHCTSIGTDFDISCERKRSKVDDLSDREQTGRSRLGLGVRFGIDTVAGCDVMEDHEPPPPEDDEDFVEQEDDDIGDSDSEHVDEFSHDELLAQGEEVADGEEEEDVFEDCERILSDTEEDRYGSSGLGDTRSRYRSEPNLSAIGYQHQRRILNLDSNHRSTNEVPRLLGDLGDTRTDGKSQPATLQQGDNAGGSSTKQRMNINFFKNKLIKGVSMGNLRFPFGNDASKASKKNTNRAEEPLVRRMDAKKLSVDITKRDSLANCAFLPTLRSSIVPSATFTTNGSNDDNSSWSAANYLTSTPGPAALISGRNSMSPITKSTQRMPKSMQESIMTPRSRKPVMLLAAMNGNDQQQLSTTCASFSSLKEEDEEVDLEPVVGVGSVLNGGSGTPSSSARYDRNLKQLINDTGLPTIGNEVGLPPIPNHFPSKGNIDSGCMIVHGGGDGGGVGVAVRDHVSNSLASPFRDYLLSRGLMPAESPADLSFASRSDDFESSAEILDRLSESKMSESLLYCLNGNEPKDKESTTKSTAVGALAPVTLPRYPELNSSELDETAL